MAHDQAPLKAPWWLACTWLLAASLSALAVLLVLLTVPAWHTATHYLQVIAGVQTWVSIAACVGLLALSKRKHAETEEEWARGALLIYVLGGVLTAVLLNYGVLPQWLASSSSLVKHAQMLGLMVLHWVCALQTWRTLRRFTRP